MQIALVDFPTLLLISICITIIVYIALWYWYRRPDEEILEEEKKVQEAFIWIKNELGSTTEMDENEIKEFLKDLEKSNNTIDRKIINDAIAGSLFYLVYAIVGYMVFIGLILGLFFIGPSIGLAPLIQSIGPILAAIFIYTPPILVIIYLVFIEGFILNGLASFIILRHLKEPAVLSLLGAAYIKCEFPYSRYILGLISKKISRIKNVDEYGDINNEIDALHHAVRRIRKVIIEKGFKNLEEVKLAKLFIGFGTSLRSDLYDKIPILFSFIRRFNEFESDVKPIIKDKGFPKEHIMGIIKSIITVSISVALPILIRLVIGLPIT